MARNLAELLGAANEAVFVDHFARKQFLLMQGDAQAIEQLVSLDEIDRLLATGLLVPPRVGLYRSGEPIAEKLYIGQRSELLPTVLQSIVRKGASLVIDDIGVLVPRLTSLERAIERRLLASTSINAYLSMESGGTFAAHYDPQDVLIIQVYGAKNWQTFSPVESNAKSAINCTRRMPDGHKLACEHKLVTGQMLFIPRGTWHRAEVDQGGTSLHLTVTIVGLRGTDYIDWARDALQSDDLAAQDIPRLAGADALQDYAMRLRARILDSIDSGGIERFLAQSDSARASDAGYRFGAGAPAETDRFATALRYPLLPGGEGPDGRAVIRANDETHRLSPQMTAILRAIEAAEHGMERGALTHNLADRWPSDEIDKAIARLLDKGLIRIT